MHRWVPGGRQVAQAGDEVGGRGAVGGSPCGGQGGHGRIVQVEGTAVRGVGVERA